MHVILHSTHSPSSSSTYNTGNHARLRLVLGGSLLAGLELVKIPAADREVALVLVHALAEVHDIGLADCGSP